MASATAITLRGARKVARRTADVEIFGLWAAAERAEADLWAAQAERPAVDVRELPEWERFVAASAAFKAEAERRIADGLVRVAS